MRIGEVAHRSGVSARMLRHYDALGLVRPTGRTVGNYREYSAADIRRIFHVESLRSLGLSLREIGRALADPGFEPATLVAELIRKTEERLRQEEELLERLRTVDASAPSGWQDVLRIVELVHGLGSPSSARRQQTVLTSQQSAPDVLAEAVLAEPDPHVGGALRWALARTGGGLAGLVPGMSSDQVDVRRRAVRAIAGIDGEEADAVLTEALEDADAEVRGQAALALGKRGSTAAVPVLVAMVVAGTNDVEAAEVLGALAPADDRIVTALVGELATAGSAVRIRLIQALVELPPDQAEGVLEELTQDSDRDVALVATALLGRLRRV